MGVKKEDRCMSNEEINKYPPCVCAGCGNLVDISVEGKLAIWPGAYMHRDYYEHQMLVEGRKYLLKNKALIGANP